MRAVLLIVMLAIVLIIGAVATGLLNLRQVREGQAPELVATRNSISTKGGQAPAFDVETGSVKVGTKETSMKVPTLEVSKPHQNRSEPTTNRSM
jgi:hypothetical protein